VLTDEELLGLEVPTLLLYGEREVIYDVPAGVERVRRLIPKLSVEVNAQVNHVTTDSQPEPVNAALLRFLAPPT
jgi:pimeloyl-ACP methyl ester carboxylesterase